MSYRKVLPKAVTYDERPKMKRDTRQKSSLYKEKDCFLSGISLHFRPFIVRYGFSWCQSSYPTYQLMSKACSNLILIVQSMTTQLSTIELHCRWLKDQQKIAIFVSLVFQQSIIRQQFWALVQRFSLMMIQLITVVCILVRIQPFSRF